MLVQKTASLKILVLVPSIPLRALAKAAIKGSESRFCWLNMRTRFSMLFRQVRGFILPVSAKMPSGQYEGGRRRRRRRRREFFLPVSPSAKPFSASVQTLRGMGTINTPFNCIDLKNLAPSGPVDLSKSLDKSRRQLPIKDTGIHIE